MALLSEYSGNITQGTIVDGIDWGQTPSPLSVVLTNPCDLEWGKAAFLLVAALLPAREVIQASKEFKDKISDSTENALGRRRFESVSKYIESFIHNINIVRYFFVDTTSVIDAPPLLVDFQFLRSTPFDNISDLRPLAELRSPHREKMIIHFSSYVSRIGVDRPSDVQKEQLVSSILESFHQ